MCGINMAVDEDQDGQTCKTPNSVSVRIATSTTGLLTNIKGREKYIISKCLSSSEIPDSVCGIIFAQGVWEGP